MGVLSRLRMAAQPLVVQLRLSRSRAYGSAAALDYDYEYYYEDEKNEPAGKNLTVEESEGWFRKRGVQWVIIGDELMGTRHVYAEKLSQLLEVPHISMGTLVQQELHPHSSLYEQIPRAVNEGKLVPEDAIFRLLTKRLEEGYSRGETGFILDGIPRTRVQAEILDQIVDIDLAVNLKCTEECLWKNYQGNGISSASLESPNGHLKSSSPDIHGIWKEKLRLYAEQNKPVEDYYRRQKKLLDFQVAGALGETWQGLLAALHLQHINAAYSSQKLTA